MTRRFSFFVFVALTSWAFAIRPERTLESQTEIPKPPLESQTESKNKKPAPVPTPEGVSEGCTKLRC
eukprot:symbB.v1.2.019148.t1/scaffold1555.1/size186957/2